MIHFLTLIHVTKSFRENKLLSYFMKIGQKKRWKSQVYCETHMLPLIYQKSNKWSEKKPWIRLFFSWNFILYLSQQFFVPLFFQVHSGLGNYINRPIFQRVIIIIFKNEWVWFFKVKNIFLPVEYVEHKVAKNVCREFFVDKFVNAALPSSQDFRKTSEKTCIGHISRIGDRHLDSSWKDL